MRLVILVPAAIVLVALFAAFKLSRAGYESPEYLVQMESGPFEIREYPPMVLAWTPMDSRRPDEGDSFRRLFRYISGANATSQKIAMTTPVLMTREAEGGWMSFIAPRELAKAGVPPASHKEVHLETMDGGRFAVYRFSGGWDPDRLEEAEQKLVAWTRQKSLETVGPPIMAGYDPPFTRPSSGETRS